MRLFQWVVVFALLPAVGPTFSHKPTGTHYGYPALIGPAGIHEMSVPLPPRGWPERAQFRGSNTFFQHNGLVVESGFTVAVRYDPARHRFRSGLARFCTDCGVSAAGNRQTLWTSGGQMGCISVFNTGFTWKPGQKAEGPTKWNYLRGQPNGLVVTKSGDAWVAGWRVSYHHECGWLDVGGAYRRRHSAPGLPSITPKGWAALFLLSPKTGVERVIHVPVSGPLTGEAERNNHLWALNPYTRCLVRRGRRSCSGPQLMEYSPETGHFKTFSAPRTLHLQPIGGNYYNTPMAAGSDGSVWAAVLEAGYRHRPKHRHAEQLTLVGFVHGRFVRYRVWWSHRDFHGHPQIFVDRQGRVWLTGRNYSPWFIDPRTSTIRKLPLRNGELSEDAHGTIWFVKGPPY